MYKLIGHSLTRGAWFEPESQPTILTERNSTSTITLGPDGPDLSIDDWILDRVQDEDIVHDDFVDAYLYGLSASYDVGGG